MAHAQQPTVQEVSEELNRVLEDAAFRRAPSHSRLLRYLVERKTSGDDGALCEAGIAMAVFQRDPAAYDAEIDPIVRVSIGRLRNRLEKHYQRFDRMPETIIVLPKGRYAPEFRHRTSNARKITRGLAVMHSRNLTGNPAFDAVAQGLSDRLSEALVLMGLARVIAPTSVRQVQDAMQSPVAIAQSLGTSEVIETVLSSEPNQRLRVSARLINAADGELKWAEVRMTAPDNPHAGIDALFDAVLARFAPAPGVQAHRSSGSSAPAKSLLPAAARSKVESARMLITHLSVASIDQARVLLAEVTRECPDAADAWALLGRTCVRRLNFGDLPPPPLVAQLEECVRTAIVLDPDHVDALALRALTLHWRAALPDAEVQFRDVLRAAPNHTSARLGFSWLLTAQGRFDEALTELDAAGSFDPLSMNVLLNRACVLAIARRHDEARTGFETGMRAGGESLFLLSASAHNELWRGDLDLAEALYRRGGESAPGNPVSQYGLACVAALRGDVEQARALQRTAQDGDPGASRTSAAELSAYLRDRTTTLAALRDALTNLESGRILLGVNCAFEWLADDPDFLELLRSLGLARWCGVRTTEPAANR